ncbi:MAG TPA: hypothetical protein VFW11_19795 [Cyclobacteriaceae bacterium]|nr:hypothetical protein [Cyclobacteriaceae bacterium]
MKKYLPILLIVMIFGTAAAQDVVVVQKSEKEFRKAKSKEPFQYLESGIDSTRLTYVATLEVSGLNNPSLFDMFKKLKDQAKRLGANSYKLRKYSQATIHIVADVYRAPEEVLDQNKTLKPQNTIFVFAGDPFEKTGYYTFEMNGIGKTVKNGTYYKYTLHEGEQVKLKKGAITGTIMWVKWKPNQLPNYLTIRGFNDEAVVKRTTQSESFKEGKFHTVDSGLAGLLVSVLEEKD